MTEEGHGVGVAFALCTGAGLATILGGSIVFSKRLLPLANPVSLAIALSVSAGVMMFISLVEIFRKAVEALTEGMRSDSLSEKTVTGHAWLITTASFALGIALVYGIDLVVHRLSPDAHAATDVEQLEHLRESIDQYEENPVYIKTQSPASSLKMEEQTRQQLVRMGLLSALAIGLHNLPEGIATYVGAIKDSSVGFSLAVGIGLHNIPEGIAVASTIYFATGSQWKGMLWCTISALAEPFGGFLAWALIGDGMNPVSEGILFGVVCGIMVCISVKELLPTAYRLAKDQTHLITLGTLGGMFIMVLSLITFGYAGA